MTVARNVSTTRLWPQPPALDEAWLERLDAVARAQLGVNDLQGARLAEAIARVSHAYTRERDAMAALQADDDALCARLKFFLPRDVLKVHGPLTELAAVGALPARETLHVLDLGAGLGTTSLGVARFAADGGITRALEVTAVDVDGEALAIFEAVAREHEALQAVPIALTSIVADLRAPHTFEALLAPRYDLIVMGLALNELRTPGESEDTDAARAAQRLVQLSSRLAPDGVLLVIEPALRETSRFLHAVRDVLAARDAAPFVFAPCLRSAACPMRERPRDFCHERVPFSLPARLARLADGAGLRDTDLTYSYLTLHAARRSLRELGEGVRYRAVSALLPSKGKLELWLCGEHAAPRAMRLDRHESEANAAFEQLGRGALVAIQDDDTRDHARETQRLRIGPDTRLVRIAGWNPRA